MSIHYSEIPFESLVCSDVKTDGLLSRVYVNYGYDVVRTKLYPEGGQKTQVYLVTDPNDEKGFETIDWDRSQETILPLAKCAPRVTPRSIWISNNGGDPSFGMTLNLQSVMMWPQDKGTLHGFGLPELKLVE